MTEVSEFMDQLTPNRRYPVNKTCNEKRLIRRKFMIADINSEDRLVQKTFADLLHDTLGGDSVFAWNDATCCPHGSVGRDLLLPRQTRGEVAV